MPTFSLAGLGKACLAVAEHHASWAGGPLFLQPFVIGERINLVI